MSDDRDERPRLTWREIDQRRSSAHYPRNEPRGRRAEQEQARASRQAMADADALFSDGPGGAAGAALASQMRDAHGGPEFLQACRQFRQDVGVPSDPALLSLFLDSGDRALMVDALEALLAARDASSLQLSPGLRSQLRVLAQDRDDTLAGISEELLEE